MSSRARSPQAAPPAGDRLDAILHAYGESVRHFFREQRRSAMVSPLFNLPGRLVLGSYCYYEHLPALLEELLRYATPEDFGRWMKHLCSRPNYIHLNSLALGYLNGREQLRLRGLRRPDDSEATRFVLDFWARAAQSYRNDGVWLPDQAGFTIPILPPDSVRSLARQLRPRATGAEQLQLRRMLATLELYTFVLNGEARVGVFHHGPYPLAEGECLLVKEWSGLQEDYYSWAQAAPRLPFDRLARVMRLRDVRAKLVLFGSLTLEPRDFEDRIVAEEIFLVEEDRLRPFPGSEAEAVTRQAADAQMSLYRNMLEWDDRYRVAYGGELYGCLLAAFAAPLGRRAEFATRVRERFRESVERHTPTLCSGQEPPLVLQHIATTDGPIYFPLPGGRV